MRCFFCKLPGHKIEDCEHHKLMYATLKEEKNQEIEYYLTPSKNNVIKEAECKQYLKHNPFDETYAPRPSKNYNGYIKKSEIRKASRKQR